jgi:hypothetical protein
MFEVLNPNKRAYSSNIAKLILVVFSCIISTCKAQLDNLVDKFPTILSQNKDNSFNVPLNQLFWASMNPETKYTLSKDTFGSLVSPKTMLESNSDIEKFNFNRIDITRRINETAFVAVFEGSEMAVQHVNGTGDNKL